MGRRTLIVLLIALPAAALAALGVVVVASATARHGAAAFGVPSHYASRQLFALVAGALLAIAVVQLGPARLLRAAPVLFAVALLAGFAVFAPGVGVRASGANRWLHLGPFSFNPAPVLTAATALLIAASRRPLTVGLSALAVLTFVAQPDFSAAAITAFVMFVALAASGTDLRKLVPAAAGALLVLALLASRFGYVSGRVSGFLAPETDRRGKGYEVLALARAQAAATPMGVGLGRGIARRRLSSPDSDYVFAVITEEMGRVASTAVVGAWSAIGAGALLAARGTSDLRLRGAALGAGAAALAPAALHVAVCQGLVPIMGVSMPLVSYDPVATLAAGAELGVVAAVALSPRAEDDA
jgi:cell division protein FtsW (lipid II flippase)